MKFSGAGTMGGALALLAAVAMPAFAGVSSNNEAFTALRGGDKAAREEARAYLKAKGVKSLWALDAEFKKGGKPADMAPLIEVLGEFPGQEGEFMLTQQFKRATDPLEIAAAVRAAGKLARFESKVSPYLGHSDERVRAACVDAIAAFGPGKGGSIVREALTSPDALARATALEGAGRLGLDEFARQMLAALDDRDARVVGAACRALGNLRYADAIPRLAGLSMSRDEQAARGAVAALAAMGTPASEEALNRILAGPGSDDIKLVAIDTLRQRGIAGVEVLLGAMAFAGPKLREEIRKVVMEDGGPAIMTTLVEMMASDNAYRSKSAGDLLFAAGPKGEEALYQALHDTRPQLRQNIRNFFVLQGERVVSRLNGELANPDPEYVGAVLNILASIGHPTSLEPIAALKTSPNIEIRRAVAKALAAYGSSTAMEQLAALAGDLDGTVRRTVLDAAMQRGGESSVTILLQALSDPAQDTRITALRALGATRSDRAAEKLGALLGTSEGYEKRQIIETLGKMNTSKADEILVQVVATEADEGLRGLAQKGLKD